MRTDSKGERGVSTVMAYITALGITAVLLAIIIGGGSDIALSKAQGVTETELELTSEDLAGDVERVDRLVVSGDTTSIAQMQVDLPERAGGGVYSIHVTDAGDSNPETAYLRLVSDSGQASSRVFVRTATPIQTTTIQGGDVVVTYNETADVLVIQND